MKWVKPFAIGYEYVCIPDKVKPYARKVINLIGNNIYMHRPRNNILSLEI